jgi:hypothetical protein
LDEPGTYSTKIGFVSFFMCEDCKRFYKGTSPEYGDEEDCDDYHGLKLVEVVTGSPGEPYAPIIMPPTPWWQRLQERLATWFRR